MLVYLETCVPIFIASKSPGRSKSPAGKEKNAHSAPTPGTVSARTTFDLSWCLFGYHHSPLSMQAQDLVPETKGPISTTKNREGATTTRQDPGPSIVLTPCLGRRVGPDHAIEDSQRSHSAYKRWPRYHQCYYLYKYERNVCVTRYLTSRNFKFHSRSRSHAEFDSLQRYENVKTCDCPCPWSMA